MKILHISTSDTGGAGIAALRLHQGLLNQGVDSKFLCLDKSNTQCSEIYQFPKYYPRFYIRFMDRLGFRISKNFYQQKVIANYNGEFAIYSFPETDYDVTKHHIVNNADIIVLHWIAGFLDYPSFFNKINKPIIWYLHDLNPVLGGFHTEFDMYNNKENEISHLDSKLKKKKREILKKRKIFVIGNSNWITEKARKYNVFHHLSTYNYIYLGVDVEIYSPINKNIAKSALLIKDNPLLICFGAQDINIKHKGLLHLIKSLKIVKDKLKSDSISMICFGSGESSILSHADFSVYNIGYIDNYNLLRIIYSAADLFVIPSLDESFGQTAIEAMSCGTPVICYEVGGLPEAIIDNQTGLLSKYNNIDDLSDKILHLINDQNKRIRFGLNSRNHVLKNFSSTNQAKKFIELFSHIQNDKSNFPFS